MALAPAVAALVAMSHRLAYNKRQYFQGQGKVYEGRIAEPPFVLSTKIAETDLEILLFLCQHGRSLTALDAGR